ncbi:hypothetical protein GCM10010256_73100 [Streptomyces coeruleorubidus]|nr:hypothetical protein GCM10010256_73100 [Streptomyces coeruleorubidus]
MPLAAPPSVTVVIDRQDDAIHTHTALAAHHPPSGRITLHPGPGTTSETGLAHDLLAALEKPPLLPGRFPSGRQPAWEAATAWITALPVTRLTVLRAHRLTARRAMRLLQLRTLTGIHLTLVCHRPHLPAALHQALQTAAHTITTDFQTTRHHYYGATAPIPQPADEPARPANRWLTPPALDRLVSYDSPRPCTAPCTPPPIVWRHRPPPTPLTPHAAQHVVHRLQGVTAHPRLAATVAAALITGASPPSNLPPHTLATTTTLRPRSPCTTAPATPTAAPPTPCRPGRVSSCGPRPASPGSFPARTRNCSPRQATVPSYCT